MKAIQRFCGTRFLRGVARAFDIRGSIRPPRRSRRVYPRSDAAALASDWNAVFGDLAAAFQHVREGA